MAVMPKLILTRKQEEELAGAMRQYGRDCIEAERHNKRVSIVLWTFYLTTVTFVVPTSYFFQALGMAGWFFVSYWVVGKTFGYYKEDPSQPWPASLDHSYKGLGED